MLYSPFNQTNGRNVYFLKRNGNAALDIAGRQYDLAVVRELALNHHKFSPNSWTNTPKCEDHKNLQISIGCWKLVCREVNEDTFELLINMGFLSSFINSNFQEILTDEAEWEYNMSLNMILSEYINLRDLECWQVLLRWKFMHDDCVLEFEESEKENPDSEYYTLNKILINTKYYDPEWSRLFLNLTKYCHDGNIEQVANILLSGFIPKNDLWILGLQKSLLTQLVVNLHRWMLFLLTGLSDLGLEMTLLVVSFLNLKKSSWDYLEKLLKTSFDFPAQILARAVIKSLPEEKIVEKNVTREDLKDFLEVEDENKDSEQDSDNEVEFEFSFGNFDFENDL